MILALVKFFLSLAVGRKRLLLGALAGGISSLVILLPEMPAVLSAAVHLISAAALTAAAFCPVNRTVFLKAAAAFFMISFCFCGVMTAMVRLLSPQNTFVRNNTVYIGISPVALIGMTLVCYVIMRVVFQLTGRAVPKKLKCRVSMVCGGKTIESDASVDTCNTLHEPFSNECVIVCRSEIFKNVFDAEQYMKTGLNEGVPGSIRLIPFSSVGGTGVIPAFKPEKVKILYDRSENDVSAYIAL